MCTFNNNNTQQQLGHNNKQQHKCLFVDVVLLLNVASAFLRTALQQKVCRQNSDNNSSSSITAAKKRQQQNHSLIKSSICFNIIHGSSLRLRERYEKISTAPAQRKFFDSLSCQVTTTKSNNRTAITPTTSHNRAQ